MTPDELQPLMQLNVRPSVAMVRGRGSYLWDEHDTRYLDFVQGWAVNALGHNPAALCEALRAQLDAVIHVGGAYHNRPACMLAARLTAASGLGKVFLAGSGAEVNDAAAKLARKWGRLHKGGAYEVITTLDSFHGRTLAMTSATGKAGFDRAFQPSVDGFRKIPFGDIEAARAALGPRTAAIMVEPIQGEAGAVVPPAGYLRALRELCDRTGTLLIVDEIQTGMARTGPLFAHLAEDVRPDVMTLGKGLGGGLPVSALLARDEVACFALGDHGGTFAAHPLLSAGALAVLDTLESADHQALRVESARRLEAALRAIAEAHGLTLRGRGHLWGLVLPTARAEQVRDQAFARGLLVNAARPDVLRLMPALDVGAVEIDAMQALLGEALAS